MNSEKVLPKILPGAVCRQMVRCGRSNCHCTGGDKHIAYYRFWREGGKLHKQYVRKSDLAETREAGEKHREVKQQECRTNREAWKKIRLCMAIIREADKIYPNWQEKGRA